MTLPAEYNESCIEPPLRKSHVNGLCRSRLTSACSRCCGPYRVRYDHNDTRTCVSEQVQNGLTILRNVHVKALFRFRVSRPKAIKPLCLASEIISGNEQLMRRLACRSMPVIVRTLLCF